MDLIQRALVWEAREPDVYVNFYYGFAFMDSSEAGMTFQVITNGDPELANRFVTQARAGFVMMNTAVETA